MTIKQQGGVFGRNPTFHSVETNGGDVLLENSTGTFPLLWDADASTLFIGPQSGATKNGNTRLRLQNTNAAYMELVSTTTAATGILMGDTDDSFRGGVVYDNNVDELRLWSGNSAKATLTGVGDFSIVGALSKGSGSFRIDHPIKPKTHHLVHSFIEGPQADNLYRGKVALVDGAAMVNLDEASRMTDGTFVALNGNVQCFTANECGWTSVRGNVDGNILRIEAQDATCTDTVSWMVIGERRDQHMLDADWTDKNGRVIVEPEKIVALETEAE